MKTEKKSLLDLLQDGYEAAKKPIAYIMMLLAVLLGSLPSEILPDSIQEITYSSVLLILALMLLQILFEIYEKVMEEEKVLNIKEHDQLYSEIRKIIFNSKDKTTTIKCIGVAGRNCWGDIVEKFTQENNDDYLGKQAIHFNIDIALLDIKTWKTNHQSLRRIGDYSQTIDNIKLRSEHIKETSLDGSNLNLHFYSHMPNMIGILVNNNYLFVTYTYWEIQENEWTLRAGRTNHFVYDRNDNFGGQEMINRFLGWFNYITDKK